MATVRTWLLATGMADEMAFRTVYRISQRMQMNSITVGLPLTSEASFIAPRALTASSVALSAIVVKGHKISQKKTMVLEAAVQC